LFLFFVTRERFWVLLNLGMIFFEKGAERPFQKKSSTKLATPNFE
jgi:hypothetical protein